MRFSTVTILAAVLAAVSAAQFTVDIKNFSFVPATLNVQPGDNVTWTNSDAVAHTVTTDAAGFDSGSLAQGKTYSHTFAAAGTYAYHCSIHPTMKANVVSGTPTSGTGAAPSPSGKPSSGNALSAPAKVIMAVGAGAVALTQLL